MYFLRKLNDFHSLVRCALDLQTVYEQFKDPYVCLTGSKRYRSKSLALALLHAPNSNKMDGNNEINVPM